MCFPHPKKPKKKKRPLVDWTGFAVPKNQPIRKTGRDYTLFRQELCARAMGKCESCDQPAPLKYKGGFNKFKCGHVSHTIHRSRGGDDTLENCRWECADCHIERHGPQWSERPYEFK